jgi:hypothetical protein
MPWSLEILHVGQLRIFFIFGLKNLDLIRFQQIAWTRIQLSGSERLVLCKLFNIGRRTNIDLIIDSEFLSMFFEL